MYHPDRWKGDKDIATRRMAEINVAYGVLGDPSKRAAYDKQHQSSTTTMGDEAESVDEAFDSAMSELEMRWQTAVSVLPDLVAIRQRLAKTAHRLAFAFVVLMLESKKFQQRDQIAHELEKRFLEAHFGSNPEIINYARSLIELGRQDAIRALNKYVDVLGSDLNPNLIINRVSDEFSIDFYRTLQAKNAMIDGLKHDVRVHGYLDSAKSLIEASQLILEDIGGGLFSTSSYSIYEKDRTGKGKCVLDKATPGQMVEWVKANLC